MTVSQIAFTGIAVALLGRNKAIGVGLSALLFAALVTGTSTRNLDPEIFRPELASNLTLMIQGLVVLFVGADVLILALFGLAKAATAAASRGGAANDPLGQQRTPAEQRPGRSRGSASSSALIAFWVALPPLKVRTGGPARDRAVRDHLRIDVPIRGNAAGSAGSRS